MLLLYNKNAVMIVCTKCRHRSIVNQRRLMIDVISTWVVGLILLAVGIGFTAWTYWNATHSYGGGFYVVMYGPMIGGVFTLLRAVVYNVFLCKYPQARLLPNHHIGIA
eukprot:TRINITY_DN1428_c0_g1_i2.p2 TRINITY_DN1428_c0_g1~~TRINITY_DN1428_c0_g1_i2.p2  ORF type:complete len:108 (-),score=12.23 TRINITY_DN1428_c0_g1_i2:47-370(-)